MIFLISIYELPFTVTNITIMTACVESGWENVPTFGTMIAQAQRAVCMQTDVVAGLRMNGTHMASRLLRLNAIALRLSQINDVNRHHEMMVLIKTIQDELNANTVKLEKASCLLNVYVTHLEYVRSLE